MKKLLKVILCHDYGFWPRKKLTYYSIPLKAYHDFLLQRNISFEIDARLRSLAARENILDEGEERFMRKMYCIFTP